MAAISAGLTVSPLLAVLVPSLPFASSLFWTVPFVLLLLSAPLFAAATPSIISEALTSPSTSLSRVLPMALAGALSKAKVLFSLLSLGGKMDSTFTVLK